MATNRIAAAAYRATVALRNLTGAMSADHARDSVRRFEQGRRMAAHHPDLADLDRHLDEHYEPPA